MKKFLAILPILIFSLTFFVSAIEGENLWVKQITSPAGLSVMSKGVATDGIGNSYSTGLFTGSMDINGQGISTLGSEDIFLVKYNSSGDLVWGRTIGDTLAQVSYSVATDKSNNVLITGYYYGTVDFGGNFITSVGSSDIFVAKYNQNGGLIWVRSFGGGSTDQGISVVSDNLGNVIVLSYFQNTANFLGTNLSSRASSIDFAITKLNNAGNIIWAKNYGGDNIDYPKSMAIDSLGDIYVTGQASVGGETTDIGGGNVNGKGIFISKYSSSNGNYIWGKVLGGNFGLGIATEPQTGNIAVTGAYQGNVDFGAGNISAGAGGGQTLFLASYKSNGDLLWARTYGGALANTYDQGQGVAYGSPNRLALIASQTSPMDFGGGSLFGGGYSVVVFDVSSSQPQHIWSNRSGGFGSIVPFGVDFDSSQNLIVSGQFSGSVDFRNRVLTAFGTNNAFVSKYQGFLVSPQTFWVTVSKNSGGSVYGEGINCGSDCNENYLFGTQKILNVTPDTGYRVDSITGCDFYSNGVCTLNINSAKNVNVLFEINPSVPIAPNNLSAVYDSKTKKVSLSWKDNSNNELGFKIEKKIASGKNTWVEVVSLGPGITNYIDNIDSGKYYRVTAYNYVGSSPYSNEVLVSTKKRFTDYFTAYVIRIEKWFN